MAEKYLVRDEAEDSTWELRSEGEQLLVRRSEDEPWKAVSLERVGDSGLYLLMVDNHPTELYLERRRGGAMVTIGRHAFNFDVAPWRPGAERRRSSGLQAGIVRITAPMTGSIVEVRTSPGATVAAGEVLLVIESMKMNNELRSPAAGTVETVGVTAGQRVNAGDLLVALNTEAGASPKS